MTNGSRLVPDNLNHNNFLEYLQNIKISWICQHIFNDIWHGIMGGEGGNQGKGAEYKPSA